MFNQVLSFHGGCSARSFPFMEDVQPGPFPLWSEDVQPGPFPLENHHGTSRCETILISSAEPSGWVLPCWGGWSQRPWAVRDPPGAEILQERGFPAQWDTANVPLGWLAVSQLPDTPQLPATLVLRDAEQRDGQGPARIPCIRSWDGARARERHEPGLQRISQFK